MCGIVSVMAVSVIFSGTESRPHIIEVNQLLTFVITLKFYYDATWLVTRLFIKIQVIIVLYKLGVRNIYWVYYVATYLTEVFISGFCSNTISLFLSSS